MKRVVVFCSHVYTSIGLIRCLGEAGYHPECICYGESSESADHLFSSKYVSGGKYFKTVEDAVEYLIDGYPFYDEKPVLFTIPDPPAYFVDKNRDVLSRKFELMSTGAQGGVVYWMNKANISELASRNGFDVPWAIEMHKGDQINEDIQYPVFTKSATSTEGGKCDESICQNKDELESRLKTTKSDSIIVMKYIKKKSEFNYFGISLNGRVYIDYYDERPRASEGGYGHYNIFRLCPYDAFHKRMVDMIRETGYDGLFDVEFILGDDGILYFMEVNFRVDGEVYKLLPGINLPAEWCRLLDLDSNDLPEQLPTGKREFTGMSETYDFKENVLGRRMNPFVWLYQFIIADRHILLDWRDPKPLFVKIKVLIKRTGSRLVKKVRQRFGN